MQILLYANDIPSSFVENAQPKFYRYSDITLLQLFISLFRITHVNGGVYCLVVSLQMTRDKNVPEAAVINFHQ